MSEFRQDWDGCIVDTRLSPERVARATPGAPRVAAREGQVVLVIEDSGPGLEPADLDRLGQRFFRVLGQQAPGSGLGWSIVRRNCSDRSRA